MLRLNVQ